jgi:hypothetical protein
MPKGCIYAKRVYLCQKGVFMPKGCIYAKKVYLCQKGVFMPKRCIYAKRVYLCQKGVFMPKRCIYAKKAYLCQKGVFMPKRREPGTNRGGAMPFKIGTQYLLMPKGVSLAQIEEARCRLKLKMIIL